MLVDGQLVTHEISDRKLRVLLDKLRTSGSYIVKVS